MEHLNLCSAVTLISSASMFWVIYFNWRFDRIEKKIKALREGEKPPDGDDKKT